MHTLSHSSQTCDSPKYINSTTILRNVVENLEKAGMTHPEIPNLAPLLSKKLEVQLPWPCKQGQCPQAPLTIGQKSELSYPM